MSDRTHVSHAQGCRAMRTASILVAILLACRAADGGVEGRALVLAMESADEADLARAASAGADGVVLVGDGSAKHVDEAARLSDAAKGRALKLWVGVPFPGSVPSPLAADVEGLALLVAASTGDPAKPQDFSALMAVKQKGDALGKAIRDIRKGIGRDKKLAICVAAPEILPETGRGLFVPVGDLTRDGTLDAVCLSGVDTFNFHRLRLLRDAPPAAGVWLDGRGAAEGPKAGLLERTILAAVGNDTCDSLWLVGFPMDLVARVVPDSIHRRQEAKAREEALAKAIASGEIVADQEVAEKSGNDQAAVHGVGQSFTPSRDGLCPLIQVYGALRGCAGALPPPLKVEVRMDERDMPGGFIYAKAEIPSCEFGHEPAYRWGSACLDPPLRLRKGQKYWLYLPNAQHPEGTYLWRMAKGGATERGRAWSSRYDYSKQTWVFRVYMKKE